VVSWLLPRRLGLKGFLQRSQVLPLLLPLPLPLQLQLQVPLPLMVVVVVEMKTLYLGPPLGLHPDLGLHLGLGLPHPGLPAMDPLVKYNQVPQGQ
jgi:hypothetical protein